LEPLLPDLPAQLPAAANLTVASAGLRPAPRLNAGLPAEALEREWGGARRLLSVSSVPSVVNAFFSKIPCEIPCRREFCRTSSTPSTGARGGRCARRPRPLNEIEPAR